MKRTLGCLIGTLLFLLGCLLVIATLPAFGNLSGNKVHFENWVWSPDGKKLAFAATLSSSSDIFYALYVIDSDGKNLRRLSSDPIWDAPAWSTDSHQLAAIWGDDLYVIEISSGKSRRLTTTPIRETGITWSPDGTHLAFLTIDYNPDHWQVHLINADGSNLRQITDAPGRYLPQILVWEDDALFTKAGDQAYRIPLKGGTPEPTESFPVQIALVDTRLFCVDRGTYPAEPQFICNRYELHVFDGNTLRFKVDREQVLKATYPESRALIILIVGIIGMMGGLLLAIYSRRQRSIQSI